MNFRKNVMMFFVNKFEKFFDGMVNQNVVSFCLISN